MNYSASPMNYSAPLAPRRLAPSTITRAFATTKIIVAAAVLSATLVLLMAEILFAAQFLSTAQAQAAPVSGQTFTSFRSFIQVGDDYGPACSPGYHYACQYEPYGHRYCGCWPGGYVPACPFGFSFSCRYDPYGRRVCACY